MSASATAPTASRRSSPSVRSSRAACCATSGACWKCRSARSTSSPRWGPKTRPKPVTLKQAVADEPRLQEAASADPRVAKMLAIAERLEGLYSNASTHAAGVVIGDRPLVELVPLYRDPKSQMPATQFNMKWVEPAGLVKFDFLGLKTLTVLQKAVELLGRRGIIVDISMIPLDDK